MGKKDLTRLIQENLDKNRLSRTIYDNDTYTRHHQTSEKKKTCFERHFVVCKRQAVFKNNKTLSYKIQNISLMYDRFTLS